MRYIKGPVIGDFAKWTEREFEQIERVFAVLQVMTDRIKVGTATPEGAVTADVGTLFIRTDGGASTVLYVKESGTGNTGWVAK